MIRGVHSPHPARPDLEWYTMKPNNWTDALLTKGLCLSDADFCTLKTAVVEALVTSGLSTDKMNTKDTKDQVDETLHLIKEKLRSRSPGIPSDFIDLAFRELAKRVGYNKRRELQKLDVKTSARDTVREDSTRVPSGNAVVMDTPFTRPTQQSGHPINLRDVRCYISHEHSKLSTILRLVECLVEKEGDIELQSHDTFDASSVSFARFKEVLHEEVGFDETRDKLITRDGTEIRTRRIFQGLLDQVRYDGDAEPRWIVRRGPSGKVDLHIVKRAR